MTSTHWHRSEAFRLPHQSLGYSSGLIPARTCSHIYGSLKATLRWVVCFSICALLVACAETASAAPCSYTFLPTSASADSSGGSNSFGVTANSSSCAWSATTTNGWLHTANTGTGNGTVNYTVDGNTGANSRVGAIKIGNQTFVVNQSISIGAAVNNTNLIWSTSTNYPWHGTNDTTYDGVASAASGNRFVPNSVSSLETTVVGPGVLSFWWKVSSDATSPDENDPLQFLINGNQQDQIYGQVDWNYRTYDIPVGTNILTWQYVKDAQFNAGADQGWIDQVTYTTNPPISLQDALDACGVTWTTGGNSNPTYWAGQTNVTHDGKSAAQSGAIYTSQESWMQAVVSGVSNVSFWWQVSSQTNDDFLEFYTNGVLARRISGTVNWQSNFFKLPTTTNTLKWRYFMTSFVDPSLPLGQNAGWVDQVVFNPSNAATPVITVLGDNPLNVECHTIFNDPGATALDACAGVLSVTTNGIVSTNIVGSYIISYQAKDPSGNSATNTRTVNVVDTTPPQLTLNGSNSLTIECHGAFTDPGATAVDACAGTLGVVTNGSVNSYLPGAYTIQYVSTDPSGNSATNIRTVNVVDTTPPQLTLNGSNPLTIECHGMFTDPGATALDDCAGTLGVVTNGSVNPNLPGAYTIQYVSTDPSGNSATNTRSVNVVDTMPPVIQYSFTNLTLASDSNCTATLPDLTPSNYFRAVDNCSSVTVTQSPGAGTVLGLGTNQLVLTAFDASGNSVSVTNTVVVADATPPFLVAPSDLLLTNSPGACSATNVSLGNPIFGDNCNGATVTNDAPTAFPVGTNVVTWTAIDGAGNSTNALQTVVVEDTELPVIIAPDTVTVTAAPGTSSVSGVDLGTPSTSDNCGVAGVTNDAPATFPIGTNVVNWSVTDVHGNFSNAVQNVIVNPAPRLPHRITSIVDNGDGTFTLGFAGTSNVQYIVQISLDLLSWVSVHTNTASADGTWTYTDTAIAGSRARFYRSVQP